MKRCDYCAGEISPGDEVSAPDLIGVLHYSKITCAGKLKAERDAALLQIEELKKERDVLKIWGERADVAAIEEMKVSSARATIISNMESAAAETFAKLEESNRLTESMKNALSKIHDLAGQVRGSDFINTQMGAIQAWVHEVSPCKEKRPDEGRCDCGEPGCLKFWDHRK